MAGAALAAVRAELAHTPPAVALELAAVDGGRGGGRVQLRLRPEPFHEALAATQQARPCPTFPFQVRMCHVGLFPALESQVRVWGLW